MTGPDVLRRIARRSRRAVSQAVWQHLMKPGLNRPGRTPYGAEELALVRQALISQNLCCIDGHMVRSFEQEFATAHDIPYAVASTSGTAAIHVALGALDLGPGDEVITTPITDLGTVIPIIQQNAIPVFADVDETLTLDPADVARKVTPRTKAIIAVHLFGNPCDMDALREIAGTYGLALIEDCSQAHFAEYKGRMVGTIGDIGCFSFQQSKLMTTGDGGMTITSNRAYYERMKLFVDKGWARKGFGPRAYLFHAPNYRMTELTGAVGLAQLGKVGSVVARRRAIGERLRQQLASIEGVGSLPVTAGSRHSYWLYPAIVDGFDASDIAMAMRTHKVPASGGYIGKPIYLCSESLAAKRTFGASQWPFTCNEPDVTYEYKAGLCPRAELLLPRLLILPIDETWTTSRVDRTVEVLASCLHARRGGPSMRPATVPTATARVNARRASRLRVAIVGCGQMGRWHFNAYTANPDVEVVALADTNPEAAHRLAGTSGARVYQSHREMLRSERLGGISVCVVPASHRPVVLDAIGAGVHVLCEKPLAISLAEAREMSALAATRSVHLLTAFKFRFFDEVRAAQKLIDGGALGAIVSARLMFGCDMDMTGTWYATPELSGGGVLADNGPHAVDLVEHLLGPIAAISATAGPGGKLPVEETAQMICRLRNHASVSVDLSWSVAAPPKTYLEIYGVQGTALLDAGGMTYKLATWPDWKRVPNQTTAKQAFARQIDHFVEALSGRPPSVVCNGAGERAQRLIDAAYASMRASGCTMPVYGGEDGPFVGDVVSIAARAR